MNKLREQVGRHSVALISLAVALSSLAYNTWRNEQTEANRNVRVAGIELLLKLGELDRIVFFSHYERDAERGNPKSGWAFALTIRDLGALMNEPAIGSSRELVNVWDANFSGLGDLGTDQAAVRISDAIERTRGDVLSVLADLD